MVADKLLLNDGTSNLLLNDGTSVLLLNSETIVAEGGPSGGKTKQVGAEPLVDQQLGQRPIREIPAISKSKLKVRFESQSKASLIHLIQCKAKSLLYDLHVRSMSVAQLEFKQKNTTLNKFRFFVENYSKTYFLDGDYIIKQLKKMEKFTKLMKLSLLYTQSESLHLEQTKPKSFEFKGDSKEWAKILKEELRAFTQASSFIGTVVYDSERQELFITIGSTVYTFCNVPERKFDGFEGSPSKGAFFNREIKTQHDC